MANVYDLSIEQGSSFNLNLVAKDSSGTPLNLSGYAATGAIRYGFGSTGVLLNLTSSIDPSYVSGIINVSLTPEQTSSLPVTKAVYDIEVYASNGYTFKAVRGYAEILPEVTR
jgi:hypothetical protein